MRKIIQGLLSEKVDIDKIKLRIENDLIDDNGKLLESTNFLNEPQYPSYDDDMVRFSIHIATEDTSIFSDYPRERAICIIELDVLCNNCSVATMGNFYFNHNYFTQKASIGLIDYFCRNNEKIFGTKYHIVFLSDSARNNVIYNQIKNLPKIDKKYHIVDGKTRDQQSKIKTVIYSKYN